MKAVFPPTNPSPAVWTIAQPPQIALLLPSLSHVCVMRTPSLSHMHTLHAPSWQEFSTQQQENIAASCAVNFRKRLQSPGLFEDNLFLPTLAFLTCVATQMHTKVHLVLPAASFYETQFIFYSMKKKELQANMNICVYQDSGAEECKSKYWGPREAGRPNNSPPVSPLSF